MKLKVSLILLTVISVVCDTMLLPFYPQFFAREFAIDSPTHTGAFVAATCVTVMLCFMFWARLAKKYAELHLWLVTQVVAAGFGIGAYFATDITVFWVMCLMMLAFKASYLLIYPFVLRLEEKEAHLGIVGLFSVLMHFGGIGGALLGGYFFYDYSPRFAFLVSSAGDLLQVLICVYLIKTLKVPLLQTPSVKTTPRAQIPRFIWAFGVASLAVYFSAFMARPFFASHFLAIAPDTNEILAGLAYSIVAIVALCMLAFNRFRSRISLPVMRQSHTLMVSLGLAACALWLQASDAVAVVLSGRLLLGVVMFQITVLLEVMLFAKSEPGHYAGDFAKVHVFQNIGIILAALGSGYAVNTLALNTPFYLAAAGFALTFIAALAYTVLTRTHSFQPKLS